MVDKAEIFTGDEADNGPSIEEQHAALVKEGLLSPEGDVPGDEVDEEVKKDSTDERPSWLPEKFKTVEDFVKAHEELERKLGSGEPKKEITEDDVEEVSSDVTPEERAAAEEATKKAGLDLGAVSQEWHDNGGLSEETYTKLAEAGYPKEMVDVYIDGLTSRINAVAHEAYAVVGGEEAYGEMIDWAIDNLSPDEQAAFDEAVNSGNKNRVLQAVKALKADYTAARAEDSQEPEETVDVRGKPASNVYEHMDDYLADLNDPRYDSSETFRAKVMAKLDRSNIM